MINGQKDLAISRTAYRLPIPEACEIGRGVAQLQQIDARMVEFQKNDGGTVAEEEIVEPTARRNSNRRSSPCLPKAIEEATHVLGLKSVGRVFRPGEEIVIAGRRCDAIFLITDGIAIRYRILRNGKRQILSFLVPGDFAGVTDCRFERALYSIKSLTHGAIAPIPLSKMMAVFDTHPRLISELLWTFGCDAALGEHLIAVGRRSAKERIAHLLLELFIRLQVIGLADEKGFRLPLTQPMIGDALGLSVPYVNRVIQELCEARLLRIRGHLIIIEDLEKLSTLVDFEPSYLKPQSISDLLIKNE